MDRTTSGVSDVGGLNGLRKAVCEVTGGQMVQSCVKRVALTNEFRHFVFD
jgi:hypothetical protein